MRIIQYVIIMYRGMGYDDKPVAAAAVVVQLRQGGCTEYNKCCGLHGAWKRGRDFVVRCVPESSTKPTEPSNLST